MENKTHIDFASSIALGILSVYVILESLRIHADAGEALYISPGLMPLILGCGLLACTIFLCIRSVKQAGLELNLSGMKKGAAGFVKSQVVLNSFLGLIIMGLYVFVMLERLHFIVATFIFLVAFMLFLKAGHIVKILILTVAVIALTYLVFQRGFGVLLP